LNFGENFIVIYKLKIQGGIDLYVSTNPNQVVAFNQGYHSGANAIPIAMRSGLQGNTITYGFNPALNSAAINSAALGVNPMYLNSAWANTALASQGLNSAFNTGFINPAFSGINQLSGINQFLGANAYGINPVFSSQAFHPAMASGQFNLNTIQSSTGLAQMRVDLAETNSDVVVAAELPNVSLNDMILTITDDSVSISATAWSGYGATNLFRTIALPTTIKSEQVDATYANGVLEIRAPKSDVTTRRKIKVNVSQ
jgi:HSP20 family protein